MDNNVLEHRAVVSAVHADRVIVTITQSSACSGCHAAKACTAADHKERPITINHPMGDFTVGETVLLKGRYAMGRTAIIISFVVPLILLLGVALMLVHVWHLSDRYSALGTLGAVGVYYFILSFFRKSLSKKFVFYIEKIQSN